jgi:hypothetical protein
MISLGDIGGALVFCFACLIFSPSCSFAQVGPLPPSMTKVTTSAEPEQVYTKIGDWRTASHADQKGETYYTFGRDAEQPYNSIAGKPVTPELVLSCKINVTTMYIDWKSPVGGSDDARMEVEYTFNKDEESAEESAWQLSGDKRLSYAYHPMDLIKEMNGKKSFSVHITPYGLPRMAANFSLEGLDKVLEILAGNCYRQAP